MNTDGMRVRRKAIMEKVLGGKTMQSVGDEYGISRERVRQIVVLEFSKKFPSLYEKCQVGGYVTVNGAERIRSASLQKMRDAWSSLLD